MGIEEEDIKNLLQAIRSENWGYVVRKLPQLKHHEQFMLMNALPPGTLEDVHHFLDDHMRFLQRTAFEIEYSKVAAVTILRQKDSYTDVAREKTLDLRVFIDEAVTGVFK